MRNLYDICAHSFAEGRKINLDECLYGPAHWDGPVMDNPFPYYYFLAGLVQSQRLSRIFEIGTYYGGSILSMSKGVRGGDIEKSRILTVDLSQKNKSVMRKFRQIKRLKGDVISKRMIKRIGAHFDGDIDLIYIDIAVQIRRS